MLRQEMIAKFFFSWLYPNWPVSAVFNKGVEISQIHLDRPATTPHQPVVSIKMMELVSDCLLSGVSFEEFSPFPSAYMWKEMNTARSFPVPSQNCSFPKILQLVTLKVQSNPTYFHLSRSPTRRHCHLPALHSVIHYPCPRRPFSFVKH